MGIMRIDEIRAAGMIVTDKMRAYLCVFDYYIHKYRDEMNPEVQKKLYRLIKEVGSEIRGIETVLDLTNARRDFRAEYVQGQVSSLLRTDPDIKDDISEKLYNTQQKMLKD